jgi:hypothetical protein
VKEKTKKPQKDLDEKNKGKINKPTIPVSLTHNKTSCWKSSFGSIAQHKSVITNFVEKLHYLNHVSLCFHKYLIFKIDLNDFPDIFDNTEQFYSLTLRLMCQHLYKLPYHEKSLQRLDKGDPAVELLKSRIASLQILRTFARKKTRAFCEVHLNEFWKEMPIQKEFDLLE